MKKTFLLTVLILSLAFSVTSHAAVSDVTGVSLVTPDTFYSATGSVTLGGQTYDSGLLPNADRFMFDLTLNPGTRFLSHVAEGASATAALESDGSTNVVFKLTGAGQAGLMDKAFVATAYGTVDTGKLGPVRRHSTKVKLSTVSEGTVGLFVTATGTTNDLTLNDTGVYISEGRAYVNNAVSGEKVWFTEVGEISADTWYTVETVVEILATGHVTQDARIYAADGTLIGSSGFVYVEDDATLTASSAKIQIYTTGFSTGYAMIDDWSGCVVTGTPAKATLTPDGSDVDEITDNRKVYKLVSSIALEGDSVNTDTVKLTKRTDSGAFVDATEAYTVAYDSATQAIVVEATNALPYGTTFAVELDTGRMLSSSDKYLAVDYTNASGLKYEFTTPADPFVVSNVLYTPGTGASVEVSNNDTVDRTCIVIVSAFSSDDEYLETKCGRADITAGAQNQTVVAPVVTESAGGYVQVMVWDNWNDMNWFDEDLHTVHI